MFNYLLFALYRSYSSIQFTTSFVIFVLTLFRKQADLKIGESQAAIMGGFAGPDMEDRSLSAGNLKQGSSSVGGAYDDVDNGWPVRGKFQLVELEVYANANIQPSGQRAGGGFKLWPF